MSTVYIGNTGIITAIGNDTEAHIIALNKGVCNIGLPTILATKQQLPVGEIKKTNEELSNIAIIAPEQQLPRTALLSIIAAKEAWKPFIGKHEGLRIALISANTVGGMDITEQYYDALKNANEFDATLLKYHECGSITNLTAAALGLNVFTATISTACSSSANTIMMGAKMIQQDKFDIVIAGGADALSKFTLNGFNALMILDKEVCRPYNENRQGLNLGEGAAYLVLVNEKAKQQLKIKSDIIVAGYANANDAHHQTATSPEGNGNKLAMQGALTCAGLQPKDIQYINLHGTGTQNNDAAEGAAITAVFKDGVPAVSSTKTFTGHTLGAAGAVEAVFSYLSIQEQTAWQHLRLTHKMSDFSWHPITVNKKMPINHVLSNSFGFGGNCSSLVISKKMN